MRKLAFAFLLLPAIAAADVDYTLTPNPSAKTVIVTVSPDQASATEVFRIPAWCPGFYFLQKYQDKIFDVKATDETGKAMQVEKIDPRGWRVVNPAMRKVTLSYKVVGDDSGLGFFGVNVRDDKVFVNGPAAFMYVDGKLTEPASLALKLPEGWGVATGMQKGADGVLQAGGYDELIDHPLQLGTFSRKAFKIGDYDFEAIFVSPDNQYRPNLDAQTEMLRKVAAPAIKLFGGAPFKRYVFLIHLAVGSFGGGLEHRASTVMAVPNSLNLDIETLASHEYFHTWNVKNIRPRVLGPFDYRQQVRTGNLWFAEGTTDYYANIDVYRAGLRGSTWLLDALGDEIQQLQAGDTRRRITLEEACRRTWESGGFGYGDLDYYNKGLVAGLILDAGIRGTTQGQKSLDDVMRLMYAKYKLPNPGYEEDGIRQAVIEIGGKDLGPIYDQITRTTQEVPYQVLGRIGLRVVAPGVNYVETDFMTSGSKVVAVGQSAQGAGMAMGDEVVEASLGDSVLTVKIKREGKDLSLEVPARLSVARAWMLEENPMATAKERELLAGWLKR